MPTEGGQLFLFGGEFSSPSQQKVRVRVRVRVRVGVRVRVKARVRVRVSSASRAAYASSARSSAVVARLTHLARGRLGLGTLGCWAVGVKGW